MRIILACAVLIATTAFTTAAEKLKGNVGNRTIYDDVVIARNTTCVLNGTTISGNIRVLSGAKLYANGASVIGSVKAERALLVDLRDSTQVTGDVRAIGTQSILVRDGTQVGGYVQLTEGSAPYGVDALRILNSAVTGDVRAENCKGRLRVKNSSIGGSLQFVDNHRGRYIIKQNEVWNDLHYFRNQGNGFIIDNLIGGNLQSNENTPAPTVKENRVKGTREIE